MTKPNILAGIAVLGLALAACSGEKTETTEVAQTDATAAAPTPSPAAPAPVAPPSGPAAGPITEEAPAPDNTETLSGAQLASFTGDPAAGEKAFVTCRTCHVVQPGVNRVGPSLHGIVGREAGTVAGYNYTPANANSGIVWSEEKLFQYLERVQRVIPGTKMAYAGVPDEQRRADIIAYLKTQG